MMLLKNLRFYLIRLRRASLAEMLHRLKEACLVQSLRRFESWRRRATQPPPLNMEAIQRLAFPDILSASGQGTARTGVGVPKNCLNHDCNTLDRFEQRWQKSFYANIKIKSVDPDIRAVWEPARLQHLTAALLGLREQPNVPDADALKKRIADELIQWIEANPFLYGPHYMSVMECGLRIPNFILSLQILDNLTPQQTELIWKAIYEHAWITYRRLSKYSSLGNHTVAECSGLLAAGLIFVDQPEGRKWLRVAADALRGEASRQIRADGGPLEQSFAYHRFVLDLFWLALGFMEKNNRRGLGDIKPRLIRGEEFLKAFEEAGETHPGIGDSDDGFAVAPAHYPARGSSGSCHWESLKCEQGTLRWRTFENSGYTVVRTPHGARLTFDHGPLGMPPLFNHGHADALSLTLSKNNRPMLVDPGTFKYNQAPNVRRYFKSTRAHNTINVDAQDQAVQESSFIWSHPYQAELIKRQKSQGGFILEATHDGYARLADPVWHKRTVYLLDGQMFIIRDRFGGRGVHEFEINFHLHPNASIELDQGWWRIDNGGERVFITQLTNNGFDLVKGRKKPMLGWYSSGYNLMEAASTLHRTVRGKTEDVSFVTVICVAKPLDSETLEHMVVSV
jgi:hypothetical protein